MGERERERVRQLLEHTEKLPEALSADLLSLGPEVVAPLVEILLDESLALLSAPGEGFAPIHAARLLARRGEPEALAALVQRLMRTQPGELLYDTLLYGLKGRGPAVASAALEALARARTLDERFGLLSVLSRCGAKDERIYAALLAQLQEDPVPGALNLACYGDPRALEPLARALDACPVDEETEDLFANQAVIELEAAIAGLGGTLDAAQREKVERARRSRQRLSELFQDMLDALSPPPAEET